MPASAHVPVVTIAQGDLRGLEGEGVEEFRRIPFAAPPVGELRWRPPADAPGWTGVRDATRYADGCPATDTLGVFGEPSDAEDCLYLNVTTPANSRSDKLPVIVWIPGGAFFDGSAADYDGSALARRGAVVVTVNYRVGIFGFFAHPAIDAEGHAFANYGLLDQQAALRWVRDNIAAFGGDPDNVTLSGESAGGSSTLYQMLSPAADGLFHRAINASGSRTVLATLASGREAGIAFAAKVGCEGANAAACLRALPVRKLLDNQGGLLRGVMVDGTVLPEQPGVAMLAGRTMDIPLMLGFTAQEQAFALASREMREGPLTPEGYERDVGFFVSQARKDDILREYPLTNFASPAEADIAAVQGSKACIGRWQAMVHSRHAPAYAYEFDDVTAPSYFPPVSFPMRAYHTSDIQYLFPLFRGGLGTAHPLSDVQQRVADEMVAYWVNFAATGDPNGPGLRRWDAYDPASDDFIGLGSGTTLEDYGKRNNCAFWDEVNVYAAEQ